MKNRNIISSFNNAVNGIIYAFKTEKNIKVHFIAAILVVFASLFTSISRLEFLVLVFTVSLVIMAEMFNTAVENIVDIITDKYHPLAKIAKDVSAGAVFIATINAFIVAYIIFFNKLNYQFLKIINKIQKTPTHVTFISIAMVIILVMILKSYFNKGTPFQGGMPSGHAALAFSTATAISFMSQDISVVTLCLVLALLVAQSRVEGKIHNTLEVFVGGVVGVVVTVLVFQVVNLLFK